LQTIDVLRQLAEVFDVANDGVLKFPGVRLESIPNIERHCVRIFLHHLLPLGWIELIIFIRRDRPGIESHDFGADLDDQLWKCPSVPRGHLDLDVAKACICFEEGNIPVHTFSRSRKRSVDSLRRD